MTTKSLGLRIAKTVITVGLIFFIIMSSSILVSAASNRRSTKETIAAANGLELYSDSACIKKINSISWGSFFAGESINKTVYIKNAGTTAMTLSLAQTNWSPASIKNAFTCVWNRQNEKLEPNQIIQATLTLTSAANFSAPTSFNVNVKITGTA